MNTHTYCARCLTEATAYDPAGVQTYCTECDTPHTARTVLEIANTGTSVQLRLDNGQTVTAIVRANIATPGIYVDFEDAGRIAQAWTEHRAGRMWNDRSNGFGGAFETIDLVDGETRYWLGWSPADYDVNAYELDNAPIALRPATSREIAARAETHGDADALDQIAALFNGQRLTSMTLDQIADILVSTGRTITE